MSNSNTKNNLNISTENRPNFHTFDSFMKKKHHPEKLLNEIDTLMKYKRKDKKKELSTENKDIQNYREPFCVSTTQDDECVLNKCKEINKNMKMDSSSDDNLQYAGYELRSDKIFRATRSMRIGGGAIWASGCALSLKHRFIYVHVLKSGGSTVKSFLRRALCFVDGDTKKDFLCGSDRVNMRGSNIIQAANCRKVIQDHPNFFTFSFVRNPFSRIYSSYSMAISKDYKKDVTPSFEEFLLHKRRKELSKLSPSHYVPQSAFLFDEGKCPVVDFIGKLENFEDDFNYVLNRINSEELFKHKETYGIKQTNIYGSEARIERLGGNLQNAYGKPSLVEAVVDQYPNDFINFGYDTKVVPK